MLPIVKWEFSSRVQVNINVCLNEYYHGVFKAFTIVIYRESTFKHLGTGFPS